MVMLTMAFGLGDDVCELEAEDAALLALQGKSRKHNPQNPWVEGQQEYWEVCGESTQSPWHVFVYPEGNCLAPKNNAYSQGCCDKCHCNNLAKLNYDSYSFFSNHFRETIWQYCFPDYSPGNSPIIPSIGIKISNGSGFCAWDCVTKINKEKGVEVKGKLCTWSEKPCTPIYTVNVSHCMASLLYEANDAALTFARDNLPMCKPSLKQCLAEPLLLEKNIWNGVLDPKKEYFRNVSQDLWEKLTDQAPALKYHWTAHRFGYDFLSHIKDHATKLSKYMTDVLKETTSSTTTTTTGWDPFLDPGPFLDQVHKETSVTTSAVDVDQFKIHVPEFNFTGDCGLQKHTNQMESILSGIFNPSFPIPPEYDDVFKKASEQMTKCARKTGIFGLPMPFFDTEKRSYKPPPDLVSALHKVMNPDNDAAKGANTEFKKVVQDYKEWVTKNLHLPTSSSKSSKSSTESCSKSDWHIQIKSSTVLNWKPNSNLPFNLVVIYRQGCKKGVPHWDAQLAITHEPPMMQFGTSTALEAGVLTSFGFFEGFEETLSSVALLVDGHLVDAKNGPLVVDSFELQLNPNNFSAQPQGFTLRGFGNLHGNARWGDRNQSIEHPHIFQYSAGFQTTFGLYMSASSLLELDDDNPSIAATDSVPALLDVPKSKVSKSHRRHFSGCKYCSCSVLNDLIEVTDEAQQCLWKIQEEATACAVKGAVQIGTCGISCLGETLIPGSKHFWEDATKLTDTVVDHFIHLQDKVADGVETVVNGVYQAVEDVAHDAEHVVSDVVHSVGSFFHHIFLQTNLSHARLADIDCDCKPKCRIQEPCHPQLNFAGFDQCVVELAQEAPNLDSKLQDLLLKTFAGCDSIQKCFSEVELLERAVWSALIKPIDSLVESTEKEMEKHQGGQQMVDVLKRISSLEQKIGGYGPNMIENIENFVDDALKADQSLVDKFQVSLPKFTFTDCGLVQAIAQIPPKLLDTIGDWSWDPIEDVFDKAGTALKECAEKKGIFGMPMPFFDMSSYTYKPPAPLVGLIDLIAHPGDNKLAQEAYKEVKTVWHEIKDWTDKDLDFLAISQEVHRIHHGADAETDRSCSDHNWHIQFGVVYVLEATASWTRFLGPSASFLHGGGTIEVFITFTIGCFEGKTAAGFQFGTTLLPAMIKLGGEAGIEQAGGVLVQLFPWDYEPDEGFIAEAGLVVEGQIPIEEGLELGGFWELMFANLRTGEENFEKVSGFGVRPTVGAGSESLLQAGNSSFGGGKGSKEEVSNAEDTVPTVPSLLQKVTNGIKKVRKSGWRKQLPTTKGLIRLVRKHQRQTLGNKASTGSGIDLEAAVGFGVSLGYSVGGQS